MDAKTFAGKTLAMLAANSTNIGAGAVTVAGAIAIAKTGPTAVASACMIGGGIALTFVAFNAAKGAITALAAAPATVKRVYEQAKEQMDAPEIRRQAASAS